MGQKDSDSNVIDSTPQEKTSMTESPPPPYSTNLPPVKSDTQSSPNPPQPHHTQALIRTLLINYGNWKCSHITIQDTDELHTPLYDVKLSITKPQMAFSTAQSTGTTTMATVIFHALHTRIDAMVNSTPIKLTTHFSLKSLYTYASPALQGAQFTWKNRNTSSDLKCVDEKGSVVARFHFSGLSLSKVGRLEIVDPRARDGAAFEELMVTGLAFAFYMETVYATVH